MIAKYSGTCPVCNGAIIRNKDVIVRYGDAWRHQDCPDAPPVEETATAVSGTDEDTLAAAVASALPGPATAFSTDFVPSPYQEAIFHFVLSEHGNGLIEAVAGSGKCLGRGTPVLMFDGSIKAVDAIEPGDLLMGPDSCPRRVLQTSSGSGPLYRIRPSKGEAWVCNDEHILTLVGSVTDDVFDIPLKTYVAAVQSNTHRRGGRATDRGSHTRQIHGAKLFRAPVEFPCAPTPIDPYLLGLWIGDGTTRAPSITTADQEIINYCRAIAPQYGLETVVTPEKSKASRVRFRVGRRGMAGRNTPHLLHRVFQSCVIDNCKTIPKTYLCNLRSIRLALLAGLMDTDGYIHNGSAEITSKWKSLADQIVFLCRSLGLAAYVHPKIVRGRLYYRITISGDLSGVPCLLERRHTGPRRQKKSVLRVGFSFEAIGKGNYYGFTIDGDGRFLLADFTVTHNTTTIVKALDLTPPNARVAFLAFNAHIATELKRRAPAHVHVSTIHSLGYRNMRKALGHVRVDDDKVDHIMDRYIPVDRDVAPWDRADRYYTRGALRRMVALTKALLLDTHDRPLLEAMAERYGVELNGQADEVLGLLPNIILDCQQQTMIADFDDMIWLPLVLRLPFAQFDYLFIDEAQDLNWSQIQFVLKSVAPGGRVIAVGDRKQSLYGFRGADVQAIPRLIEALNATVLPLSITYRCPALHVAAAKKLVPQIEARDGAPDGVLETIKLGTALAMLDDGDMVVCRTNAPLVPVAYNLITQGHKAMIRGRDIGKNLADFVRRFQADTLTELHERMEEYAVKEIDRLLAKGKELQADLIRDKVDTVAAIASECQTPDDVAERIEAIFSDDIAGVVLSSVHRAKGLEAHRVFILHPELMPHPRAKQSWEREQEMNCLYVALTRSKSELYMVDERGR